jgi:hypothetical protein
MLTRVENREIVSEASWMLESLLIRLFARWLL